MPISKIFLPSRIALIVFSSLVSFPLLASDHPFEPEKTDEETKPLLIQVKKKKKASTNPGSSKTKSAASKPQDTHNADPSRTWDVSALQDALPQTTPLQKKAVFNKEKVVQEYDPRSKDPVKQSVKRLSKVLQTGTGALQRIDSSELSFDAQVEDATSPALPLRKKHKPRKAIVSEHAKAPSFTLPILKQGIDPEIFFVEGCYYRLGSVKHVKIGMLEESMAKASAPSFTFLSAKADRQLFKANVKHQALSATFTTKMISKNADGSYSYQIAITEKYRNNVYDVTFEPLAAAPEKTTWLKELPSSFSYDAFGKYFYDAGENRKALLPLDVDVTPIMSAEERMSFYYVHTARAVEPVSGRPFNLTFKLVNDLGIENPVAFEQLFKKSSFEFAPVHRINDAHGLSFVYSIKVFEKNRLGEDFLRHIGYLWAQPTA